MFTTRAHVNGYVRCLPGTSGVLDRYIQARCGICARVELSNVGTYDPKYLGRFAFVSKPIRMEVLVKAGTTDEQKDELEDKLMSCMPGIRRILGSIYVVGRRRMIRSKYQSQVSRGEDEAGPPPTQ
jgi:hypothetical protein